MIHICSQCGGQLRPSFETGTMVYSCINQKCNRRPIRPIIDSERDEINKRRIKFLKHNEKIANSTDVAIMISNIKKLRFERGLGQSEISALLGVSTQRYGTIDRNENLPTALILGKLARIFDVGLEDLYTMITITSTEFEQLRNMSEIDEVLQTDPTIQQLRNDIINYELKTGITDRKVYKANNESEEIIAIKSKLKKLDEKLSKYNSKIAILKQDYVIDYYHYEKAKEILYSKSYEV